MCLCSDHVKMADKRYSTAEEMDVRVSRRFSFKAESLSLFSFFGTVILRGRVFVENI